MEIATVTRVPSFFDEDRRLVGFVATDEERKNETGCLGINCWKARAFSFNFSVVVWRWFSLLFSTLQRGADVDGFSAQALISFLSSGADEFWTFAHSTFAVSSDQPVIIIRQKTFVASASCSCIISSLTSFIPLNFHMAVGSFIIVEQVASLFILIVSAGYVQEEKNPTKTRIVILAQHQLALGVLDVHVPLSEC